MLSSQSREFHSFFVQLIVAATTLLVFAEKVWKCKRKLPHFFREVFRSLQTLVQIQTTRLCKICAKMPHVNFNCFKIFKWNLLFLHPCSIYPFNPSLLSVSLQICLCLGSPLSPSVYFLQSFFTQFLLSFIPVYCISFSSQSILTQFFSLNPSLLSFSSRSLLSKFLNYSRLSFSSRSFHARFLLLTHPYPSRNWAMRDWEKKLICE